jgi:hypothetical protein
MYSLPPTKGSAGSPHACCSAVNPEKSGPVLTSPNQFNSWADFLLSLPQQVGKSLQFYDPMSTRDWLQGYYVRDRWQATRSLTLTLGLPWEYFGTGQRWARSGRAGRLLLGG